jgi:DNA-binding PadR family transcriptional regulator
MTRYVQITQSDMDAFMEAVGLDELSVEERGSFGRRPVKERVYESSVVGPMGGRIRVYSSVVGPEARDKGKDAIRVQYWIGDRKVYGAKRVNRTENWRANVLERINDVYEMAESGALSRVPQDSRGDYMVARRSRGRHFWGSANYPEIQETRRFAAASVAPFEPKNYTDRAMMTKYLMDDAEKQEVIMKIQYGLKNGILTPDEVLELLGAESSETPRLTTKERKQAVLSALSNRRWVGRYDAPYEMTSHGIGEVIGKTRTNVEKTLKELIADGLVVREKRHVQEFSGRKVWAYQITPEGQRALNNGMFSAEEEREFCNWCKETLSETRPEARANGEQVCRPCYEAWMEEYRNDLDMHYSPFYAETVVKEAQFKPPASAISNAKRGLKLRKEYGRGGLSPSEAAAQGIDSGVTRAKRIASGTVSTHDVRRMSAFNRHRKNYRPEKKMPDGGPTAGTIAWLLWGGTSGVNWAKKKSAAMNAEEKLSKTSCCCGATEANPCACMKSAQPMKCSAIEPMCPCYAAKSAETFEAYDVASWNPADEPTEDEAVWEQFYEYCPDKELVAKLWDLEGQPGDSAESWMDSLEGTDEHENVFERHYQLIKEAAFDWWSKMYDAEDEAIKVSPFRKAKVLDIIIDWHQRNQMQSETIAYNLDRIHWLLENPDQDWEDYDSLTEDDFSAETHPDVVTDGCPVCETELSEVSDTVLRCDRCEIAWDLIVDEEGFEYLDSESDESEDYGVEPRWM